MDATVRATPRVTNAWYDPVEQSPRVGFDDGHVATWSELSDGYHVFSALVADIARRAVMLNEFDGADAPARVEGVVLIDELDLHLHPRWQREALPRLRNVFPRLQLVVTTHSPQILSSVDNRQVRRLFEGKLQEYPVLVEGRDTNAILREYMRTEDRSPRGYAATLRALHDHIDGGRREEAEELYKQAAFSLGRSGPRPDSKPRTLHGPGGVRCGVSRSPGLRDDVYPDGQAQMSLRDAEKAYLAALPGVSGPACLFARSKYDRSR